MERLTAEKLLKSKETYDKEYPTISISDATESMIEFAQFHVEAALKKASEKVKAKTQKAIFVEGSWNETIIDKDSILTAYPESNIV